MLADFCLIRVTTISAKISNDEQGTASFMAPELLSTRFGLDRPVPSKEADIFALGMTTYQVMTGKTPFSQIGEGWIIHAVISGERPAKPENAKQIGMSYIVWDLLTECWREDRTKRPNISDVLRRFCEITDERNTIDSMIGPQLDIGVSRDSFYSERVPVRCEWNYPPERPHSIL